MLAPREVQHAGRRVKQQHILTIQCRLVRCEDDFLDQLRVNPVSRVAEMTVGGTSQTEALAVHLDMIDFPGVIFHHHAPTTVTGEIPLARFAGKPIVLLT